MAKITMFASMLLAAFVTVNAKLGKLRLGYLHKRLQGTRHLFNNFITDSRYPAACLGCAVPVNASLPLRINLLDDTTGASCSVEAMSDDIPAWIDKQIETFANHRSTMSNAAKLIKAADEFVLAETNRTLSYQKENSFVFYRTIDSNLEEISESLKYIKRQLRGKAGKQMRKTTPLKVTKVSDIQHARKPLFDVAKSALTSARCMCVFLSGLENAMIPAIKKSLSG